MLVMTIRAILGATSCWPKAPESGATSRMRPQKRSRNFIIARSHWHIVVAYFRRLFESSKRLAEYQMHVAGRTVALLGDQKIHRHRVFFGRATLFIVTARLI